MWNIAQMLPKVRKSAKGGSKCKIVLQTQKSAQKMLSTIGKGLFLSCMHLFFFNFVTSSKSFWPQRGRVVGFKFPQDIYLELFLGSPVFLVMLASNALKSLLGCELRCFSGHACVPLTSWSFLQALSFWLWFEFVFRMTLCSFSSSWNLLVSWHTLSYHPQQGLFSVFSIVLGSKRSSKWL